MRVCHKLEPSASLIQMPQQAAAVWLLGSQSNNGGDADHAASETKTMRSDITMSLRYCIKRGSSAHASTNTRHATTAVKIGATDSDDEFSSCWDGGSALVFCLAE